MTGSRSLASSLAQPERSENVGRLILPADSRPARRIRSAQYSPISRSEPVGLGTGDGGVLRHLPFRAGGAGDSDGLHQGADQGFRMDLFQPGVIGVHEPLHSAEEIYDDSSIMTESRVERGGEGGGGGEGGISRKFILRRSRIS